MKIDVDEAIGWSLVALMSMATLLFLVLLVLIIVTAA